MPDVRSLDVFFVFSHFIAHPPVAGFAVAPRPCVPRDNDQRLSPADEIFHPPSSKQISTKTSRLQQ